MLIPAHPLPELNPRWRVRNEDGRVEQRAKIGGQSDLQEPLEHPRSYHHTLLPATEADAHELGPMLRTEDHAEVIALGVQPVDALVGSLKGSAEAWTLRADGRVMCMTGVCPVSLIGRVGVPWVLGSEVVLQNRTWFLRTSQQMVARYLSRFPVLRNVVDARYRKAILWLDWLGFVIRDPMPIGSGVFWTFEMEAG